MFEPLLTASAPIPVHGLLAMFALVVGAVQFALAKGTSRHRIVGYIWVSAMALVALTSFFINEYRWLGPFGPIHVLSVLTCLMLWRAISLARGGKIAAHRRTMILTYGLGLILPGAFTFLPGRIMHDVLTRAL